MYNRIIYKIEVGDISEFNSFEIIYRHWMHYMKPIYNKKKTDEIVGIVHDIIQKRYIFYIYENENLLKMDKAFLPFRLIENYKLIQINK